MDGRDSLNFCKRHSTPNSLDDSRTRVYRAMFKACNLMCKSRLWLEGSMFLIFRWEQNFCNPFFFFDFAPCPASSGHHEFNTKFLRDTAMYDTKFLQANVREWQGWKFGKHSRRHHCVKYLQPQNKKCVGQENMFISRGKKVRCTKQSSGWRYKNQLMNVPSLQKFWNVYRILSLTSWWFSSMIWWRLDGYQLVGEKHHHNAAKDYAC